MTDEISLATLPLGVGGGSFLRTILAEGALGAAGEAAVIPRMMQVSEDLDIETPDALTQIGMGFLFGGAFGAVAEGAARGFSYAAGRNAQSEATRPENADPADHRARLDAEARALEGDKPTPSVRAEEAVGRIVRAESGGRADAANPNSSALGAGQFIEDTWLSMIEKHRPDLADGRTEAEILALRTDPDLSREMTAAYAQDNIDYLASRGIAATDGDVYLAHFAGPTRAARLIVADPSDPIDRYFSAEAMEANASVRHGGKLFADFTVADIRRWSDAKMSGAPDQTPKYRPATSRGYVGDNQVSTTSGRVVDVEYEVVDLDDLQFAGGDLQPRDRSRKSSDEQIAKIAAELDPARLLPSPEADRGAPIVGPDGVIESGNGRIMAIARAADEAPDRYEAYRAAIVAAGYEAPEGASRPVLIARRRTDLSDAERVRFVQEANEAAVARMSGTETALGDARRLSGGALNAFDPGASLDAPANRAFARDFLDAIPQSERSGLVDPAGRLNAEGRARLDNALFARAFGDADLVSAAVEGGDREIAGQLASLREASGPWAMLRDQIERGDVAGDFDITRQIGEAVRMIAKARRAAAESGQSVAAALRDLMDQDTLFDDDPLARAAVSFFHRDGRARARADVAADLADYVNRAQAASAARGGLFGDDLNVGAADLIEDITGARVGPPSRASVDQAVSDFSGGAASPGAAAADAELRVDLEDARPADQFAREELDGVDLDDLVVEREDGSAFTAREMLAEIDAEREFVEALEICAAPGRAAA